MSMIIAKIQILITILLFIVPSTLAQDKGWTQVTNTGKILSIAEEDSLLWLGTEGGLVRFVKATGAFSVLNSANSKLLNNQVFSIVSDSTGTKWFGTLEGLSKWDGKVWTQFNTWDSTLTFKEGSKLPIPTVAIDDRHRLWLGGQNLILLNGSLSAKLPNLSQFNYPLLSSRGRLVFFVSVWNSKYSGLQYFLNRVLDGDPQRFRM